MNIKNNGYKQKILFVKGGVQSRALELKYIFKFRQKSLNEKIKFEILKNGFTVQNLLYYNSTLPNLSMLLGHLNPPRCLGHY